MLALGETAGGETEGAVLDDHVGVGGNDVDVIGPNLDSLGDLGNRNFGGAGKNFFERTVVAGIEMLKKDKSHAGGFREIGEQGRESFQTAGGGADTNDRENLIQGGGRRG